MNHDGAVLILMVEDDPTDAALIERELHKAGLAFTVQRVDQESILVAALDDFQTDLILADYHLPGFDGLRALAICRERLPAIPFIFVTGAMGEELAVESIKQGATDYIWFLWLDAALAVNSKWRRPEPLTPEVGRIENAKEAFRQALRPRARHQRPRDYAESDSPKIAAQVRAMGLVDRPAGISHSFTRFAERVRGLTLT